MSTAIHRSSARRDNKIQLVMHVCVATNEFVLKHKNVRCDFFGVFVCPWATPSISHQQRTIFLVCDGHWTCCARRHDDAVNFNVKSNSVLQPAACKETCQTNYLLSLMMAPARLLPRLPSLWRSVTNAFTGICLAKELKNGSNALDNLNISPEESHERPNMVDQFFHL